MSSSLLLRVSSPVPTINGEPNDADEFNDADESNAADESDDADESYDADRPNDASTKPMVTNENAYPAFE